ncbi:hypothetical protein LY78DRAFT_650467 [Colletotrichum sublineola]|nr:hypothetical protein LY78DRAFT_650467 [Colletotrichum sublineola]
MGQSVGRTVSSSREKETLSAHKNGAGRAMVGIKSMIAIGQGTQDFLHRKTELFILRASRRPGADIRLHAAQRDSWWSGTNMERAGNDGPLEGMMKARAAPGKVMLMRNSSHWAYMQYLTTRQRIIKNRHASNAGQRRMEREQSWRSNVGGRGRREVDVANSTSYVEAGRPLHRWTNGGENWPEFSTYIHHVPCVG